MEFKELYLKYKDQAIKLLEKLISYNTILDKYEPNSDAPFGIGNKEALNYLLDYALNDGFNVKNVDNYAGHIEFGEGEEILGVLAHLDVVPVDESEWDSNPFELSIRDGKMYARGTMDDKGPLVCAYIAMKMLLDSGFKPKRRVRLIAGCDEESGSRCLEHYLSKEAKPDLGFSPDASFPLIFGEKGMISFDVIAPCDDIIVDFECGIRYNMVPSVAKLKLNINLENEFISFLNENNYKGEIADGYLVAYGAAAHAMCPENGINAAFILFEFLNKYTDSRLADFFNKYFLNDTRGNKLGIAAYDEEMKELTCNFAIIRVNDGKAKLGFNCRVPLNECFGIIEGQLAKACGEYNYEYKILGSSPRHYVSQDSELVKSLMKAYVDVTGDTVNKPITIGGGTYAREIGNAVAFGPMFVGREDVCHIANEYFMIEDFDASVEIYYKSIYELTK